MSNVTQLVGTKTKIHTYLDNLTLKDGKLLIHCAKSLLKQEKEVLGEAVEALRGEPSGTGLWGEMTKPFNFVHGFSLLICDGNTECCSLSKALNNNDQDLTFFLLALSIAMAGKHFKNIIYNIKHKKRIFKKEEK